MTIAKVIAALAERLGPPDTTGEFKGNPTASWGLTRYPGPGVDCYVHAEGAARIDVYRLPPIGIGGTVRTFDIEGYEAPGTSPFRPSVVPHLATIGDADAYRGSFGTCIAPLDVAVEVAARAMAAPVTDADRERYRGQGRVTARNIAANVYREVDNSHAAQLLHFAWWASEQYAGDRSAAVVAAFREGLYEKETT